MRALAAPRAEVQILADDDAVGHWRCAEASSSTNFADAGPHGLTLTQNNTPGVAADPVTLAATGARTFNGTNQYGSLSTNTYIDDFIGLAPCSAWAWVKKTATAVKGIVSYGGTGSGGAANNALYELFLLGTTLDAAVGWMHSSNTFVSVDSDIPLTTGKWYFVGTAREPDPANPGMVRVRFHVYERLQDATDRRAIYRTATVSNLTPPDGTTSARFALGARRNGAIPIDGELADVGMARVALSEEWFREQYARAARSYDLEELFARGEFRTVNRVRAKNASGTWQTLNDLAQGRDFVVGFEDRRDIDNRVDSIRLSTFRNAGKWSLAPLVENSPLATLLKAKAEVKLEVACVPFGEEPYEWDYMLLNHGFVATPDAADRKMAIDVDGRAVRLRDMQMRETTSYGADYPGTPFEPELQAIIDDADPSAYVYEATPLGRTYLGGEVPQLFVPVDSGHNATKWLPTKTDILEALNTPSDALGFDVRELYDDVRCEFRPTFSEPDRVGSTVDWTFAAGDVRRFTRLAQSGNDTRNWLRNYYGEVTSDDAVGEAVRAFVEIIDTDSMDAYGPLYGEFNEATIGGLDEEAQVEAFLELALAELSWPRVWATVELRSFAPWVELGDRLRFTADGEHFDSDLEVCVVGITHSVQKSGCRTTLDLRGEKPAIRRRGWFERMVGRTAPDGPVRTPDAPDAPTVTSGAGHAFVQWPYPIGRTYRGWSVFEVHRGTTAELASPSASTLMATVRGTSAIIGALQSRPAASARVGIRFRDAFGNVSAMSSLTTVTSTFTTALPRCKVRAHQAHSTSSGWTRLRIGVVTGSPADTEDYDIGGIYNFGADYRVEHAVDGQWRVTGRLQFASTGLASTISVRLEDGSSNVISEVQSQDYPASVAIGFTFCFEIPLTVEIIEVWFNDSRNRAPQANTWWAAALIGDGT